MNEGCPCDSVEELKKTVRRHEQLIHDTETMQIRMEGKLDSILEKMEKHSRLSWQTVSSVIQAVCTLLVALIAADIGLK